MESASFQKLPKCREHDLELLLADRFHSVTIRRTTAKVNLANR